MLTAMAPTIDREQRHRPEVGPDLRQAVALQQDAAADPQRVRQRHRLADRTAPSAGMPWNGNMKPDSIIDGSKRELRQLLRLHLRRAMVENAKPIARLQAMNTPEREQQQRDRPAHRHFEHGHRHRQDQRDLHIGQADIGDDLAQHHLHRPHRHRQQVLHRARSRARA